MTSSPNFSVMITPSSITITTSWKTLIYYKDIENANRKIKYYDPLELTKAREFYASQNVEINYFNPTDQFTYQTYSSRHRKYPA